MNLYVVVPVYNEEKYITATLEGLARQTDNNFTLVLVDNGSTDRTFALVEAFAHAHPAMRIECIDEPEKGTGCAADTGFRYAIEQGATHIARTDADCIPAPDWITGIRRAFSVQSLEFVGGVIRPRDDERPLTWADRRLIDFLLVMADVTGRLRRRGRANQYPYFLVAGNNLAITAELYLRSGGFPRTSVAEAFEDRLLSEAVRKLTTQAARVHDVIVYNSLRRVHAYGYVGTILWYWDHIYAPSNVDVR